MNKVKGVVEGGEIITNYNALSNTLYPLNTNH
jgi:hypothetical protein